MRHVLRQLPFQHVLLLFCALQPFVYFDYPFGDFAQFVAWEAYQVFRVEALVVVGAAGEEAQLGYVVAQSAYEAVEYQHENEHRHEREPQVVLVGLQRFGQAVVVGRALRSTRSNSGTYVPSRNMSAPSSNLDG